MKARLKPGKSVSVLAMIVGIGFIIIGVTQVIPSGAGFFGILWTAMAIGITGFYAYNLFSSKGISVMDVDVKHDEEGTSNEKEDFDKKLRKLEQLKKDNLISEGEYKTKRNEIIQQI